MIRRLIRFLLYLFVVAVVLAVAAVLLKDTLAKELMQHRIRKATGMDARIGQVEVGLLSPTVTIEDLKLYNSPAFGGSLCLDMPELHMEYDPQAMRAGRLHFSLMRLDLAEIDVVEDRKGHVNFDKAEEKAGAGGKRGGGGLLGREHIEFAGIDALNVTLGTLKFTTLANGRQQVYQMGVKNQVFRHIKSEADLAVLLAVASATHATNTPTKFSDFVGSLFGL